MAWDWAEVDPVGAVGAVSGLGALLLAWHENRVRRRAEEAERLYGQVSKVYVYFTNYVAQDGTLIHDEERKPWQITGSPKVLSHRGILREVLKSSEAPIFFAMFNGVTVSRVVSRP
jgi:hypothetical protein